MPVGSKALAEEFPTHVSSATVRNDMAALESKGLINKTHFSSGRVPSIEGYRYYLDNLVQPDPLDEGAEDLIKTLLTMNSIELMRSFRNQRKFYLI